MDEQCRRAFAMEARPSRTPKAQAYFEDCRSSSVGTTRAVPHQLVADHLPIGTSNASNAFRRRSSLFSLATLIAPEPREADGSAQFPEPG